MYDIIELFTNLKGCNAEISIHIKALKFAIIK